MRYLVEGIGFNDGSPFTEHETENLDEARTKLDEVARDSPRIGHRLIQVIEERAPSERAYLV